MLILSTIPSNLSILNKGGKEWEGGGAVTNVKQRHNGKYQCHMAACCTYHLPYTNCYLSGAQQ